MIQRNHDLAQRAMNIWKRPNSTYTPPGRQLQTLTLEDAADLPGKMISRYSLRGTERSVVSWIEMFEGVVSQLHADDPSVLTRIAHDEENNDLSRYIRATTTGLRNPTQIAEGIYVEANTNTWAKTMILIKLLPMFQVELTELALYLRDDQTPNDVAEETPLQQFWAYAIPLLKEGHVAWQPLNPDRQNRGNYANARFGLDGSSISCIARKRNAQVELYLGSSDHRRNLSAFDYLYRHRDAIESEIGHALTWRRDTNMHSCNVQSRKYDVGYSNNDMWTGIADFLSKTSAAFYDALVPRLLEWSRQYVSP